MPERSYQELSLLPVMEEIAWDRALFESGAEAVAAHLGYEPWKKNETARALENLFSGALATGKTFDDAVKLVKEAVDRVVCSARL